MIINYNVSAMVTNNALARNDSALSKALERLSSGYKINHAKDNAAGLAMARRMNAQLEGLSVAGDNTTDGISIVEIADGAMSEVHDILQRMNELAVKSANGTLNDEDRVMIDAEYQAMKEEIERIGSTTQFNGQNLLDGTFNLKGYSSDAAVSVDCYSEELAFGKYTIGSIQAVYDAEGDLTEATTVTNITDPEGNVIDAANYKVEVTYDQVTITTAENEEIKFTLDKDLMNAAGNTLTDITLDLTGIGSMTLQVGANEDQIVEICIPPVTQKNLGIHRSDVLTEENAGKAIDEVKQAITTVSSIRSSLGAYQNRLEHTTTSLDLTSENLTGAYSRIMDVDMAEEMTRYSSLQVINQAATSMLAQANERPSQVLQLLQ